MKGWYYVRGSERIGPVDQADLESLVQVGELNEQSYVWKKGFDNWRFLSEVDELAYLLDIKVEEEEVEEVQESGPMIPEAIPARVSAAKAEFAWDSVDYNQRNFHIKVGVDRGGDEAEYGPFSLNELRQLFSDGRINERTFLFSPGMSNWSFIGDLPIYSSFFTSVPPQIDPVDRRVNTRKPFVARLLFHDDSQVYEGICRDISVGGLQVLVSDFPARVGEFITMNVHPDNGPHKFTAKGVVVRVLDGNQGFSLRFKDMSAEAHQAIESYVNNS
jgi:hypothetical protein